MRNGVVASLLVVVVIASAGVGYFVGVNHATSTSASSPSSKSTGTLSETTQSTVSVTCVQTLSAPLYLIVKDDNGTPIPDQPLSIQARLLVGLAYNSTTESCDRILSTQLWANETGSDGKIELGATGDIFNVTTSYLGKTYYVNADAEGAESAECITLSLPSGAVNTTFAGLFQYQC